MNEAEATMLLVYLQSQFFSMQIFLAKAEVIDESSPPESKTPYGTSLISCLLLHQKGNHEF
ncbi:MAG: hypothetical protein CM15mP102_11250 [Flavobacteriales bacterium]|nr:MAG: hypothetical protein CM15mP102_11250 [Flavobacteriales bacterium]